jgi:hypothetical protein
VARYKVTSHRLRGLTLGDLVSSQQLDDEARPIAVLVAAGHLTLVPDPPKVKPAAAKDDQRG